MNCNFNLLCWMATGLFLCSCGVSAGSIGLSSSSPQANSSAPVGLHGYRRYFANDSLIGRPVPCTREDKICFRHNLVYDPVQEICLPIGGNEALCTLIVNREELEHESGRVVGTCRGKDPCTGHRMAYDGICYKKEIVDDVICGGNVNLTRHLFGNEECRSEPATPIKVQQPEEDGSCVIPDLRFPDTKRSAFFNNTPAAIQGFKNNETRRNYTQIPLECGSDANAECFSRRMVFVPGFVGCHKLLKQGPCAEEHVVALDAQAATEGRAEGTCVHVRGGCPPGHKRMLFDNQCHEDREIAIEAPGEIILNQFGRYIVDSDPESLRFIPKLTNGKCAIDFAYVRVIILHLDILDSCMFTDEGECSLEVINEPPQPEM